MSKRTKATDISPKVRQRVYERDSWENTPCCIKCGTSQNIELAHYLGRGIGGLGIEENLVCLCRGCHRAYDQSARKLEMKEFIKNYLDIYYPSFTDEERKFKK